MLDKLVLMTISPASRRDNLFGLPFSAEFQFEYLVGPNAIRKYMEIQEKLRELSALLDSTCRLPSRTILTPTFWRMFEHCLEDLAICMLRECPCQPGVSTLFACVLFMGPKWPKPVMVKDNFKQLILKGENV